MTKNSHLFRTIAVFCAALLVGWLPAKGCDSGGHHSTLYHHNRSVAILVGTPKALPKKKTEAPFRCTFVVQHWYKKGPAEATKTIELRLPAQQRHQLQRRQSYLLYLTTTREGIALYCEAPLPLTDSSTQRQIAYLDQLDAHYTGELVERSPYGLPWARGRLEQGRPVGEWQYYAHSGELQWRGVHTDDSTQWVGYHHTPDATYRMLDHIRSGRYYAQTGDYRPLGVDTLAMGVQRYCLRYTVGGDTLQEYWHYRQAQVQQRVSYYNGWRHGLEARYDADGRCVRRYHFSNGQLDGAFWERQNLPNGSGFVHLHGQYTRDEKQSEQHDYYRSDGQLERQLILVENGRVIVPPRVVGSSPEASSSAPSSSP